MIDWSSQTTRFQRGLGSCIPSSILKRKKNSPGNLIIHIFGKVAEKMKFQVIFQSSIDMILKTH